MKAHLTTFATIAAFAATALSHAQTQTNCPLVYIASDNSTNGSPNAGFAGNYGYISEQDLWSIVNDTNPGCCQDITWPSCKQPVDPLTSPAYSNTQTVTTTQTQNFDASITIGAIFKWLTGAGWHVTKGTSYTGTSTVVLSQASQTVNCGNRVVLYLGTITTKTHETRTDTNSTIRNRDQTVVSYSLKLRQMGSQQTCNPCTDQITGPKCPPISIDIMCLKPPMSN